MSEVIVPPAPPAAPVIAPEMPDLKKLVKEALAEAAPDVPELPPAKFFTPKRIAIGGIVVIVLVFLYKKGVEANESKRSVSTKKVAIPSIGESEDGKSLAPVRDRLAKAKRGVGTGSPLAAVVLKPADNA